MTRDEQLIKAALDMAAETCEKSAYAADADGHHFAYSIRAISPADVLEKVGANEPERPVKPCPDCGAQPARVWRPGGAFQMRTECACGRVTNWVMCGHDAVADSDDDTPQPASSCQPPQHGDESYYSKGKTAEWWVDLTDEQFAWELICAAQDLNDTGLGDDLDKWMPHQVMLADAANRIKRLSTDSTSNAIAPADVLAKVGVTNTELEPPRLMAMCGYCRSAGEEYCVQYLKDLRWDGVEWCCKDCFDGSGENGDWDEATQPCPQPAPDAVARLVEAPAAWQPIETAPRDGAWIIVCVVENGTAYRPSVGTWDFERKAWSDGLNCGERPVTHWMPLPAPPLAKRGTRDGE